MRLVRIILEGLLVTALAALVFYPFRHHLLAGLLLVIGVCLVAIGAITALNRRRNRRSGHQAPSLVVTKSPELEVAIEAEEMVPPEYLPAGEWVVGVKLRVKNLTGRDQAISMRFDRRWPSVDRISDWHAGRIAEELRRERPEIVAGIVPALSTATGWYWEQFPASPTGLRQSYTVWVTDGLGTKYELHMTERRPVTQGSSA